MIVMPLKESKGQKIVLPSGFWLANDFRTSASFTTATNGPVHCIAVAEVASGLQRNPQRPERARRDDGKDHGRGSRVELRRHVINPIGPCRIDVSRWRHRCSGCQHSGQRGNLRENISEELARPRWLPLAGQARRGREFRHVLDPARFRSVDYVLRDAQAPEYIVLCEL